MNKKFVLFGIICALIYWSHCDEEEDIRCTANSCKDVTCDEIPTKCKRNTTNPGTFLLSPDICNCCEYCLVNLEENEVCSIGEPSNGKHTSICGPGLTCIPTTKDQSDGTCQKMETSCTLLQSDFDKRKQDGTLGQMETKALCDDDGLFGNYKCIPGQTCYCQKSDGSRIFGQADYSTIANYMPCDCSRKYHDAVDLIGRELGPHEHFRCSANGNYDPLQCINGKCLCVDVEDGAPTYPAKSLVNITLISKFTLPCYTSETPGQYYKPCEEDYMEILKIVKKLEKDGYSAVLGYVFPKCDLDGTYYPVQENKTHKYCVNAVGRILTAVNKTEADATTMDCKCVRANLVTSTIDKPNCLPNGNYNPIQCRRGVCRCVDSDGNQKCTSTTCEYDERDVNKMKC